MKNETVVPFSSALDTHEMALRIGNAYHGERVTKTDVEKLAADAGLSRPLVHRRLPELVEAIVTKLKEIQNNAPTVQALAVQIRIRCQHVLELW